MAKRSSESELVERVRSGERLALSRLLTLVENDTQSGRDALDALFPYSGKAQLVGITGSPGTGKSSLVNQLAKEFRMAGSRKVAIIAVDPSSPFTGGALLGDRIRMRDLSGDPDIFIRSMASRGALGGLSRSTASVAQVLDAAGYGLILIETVGAGQSEVDIARLAHTVVVVESPGLGDDIQAIKAGILEIADIIVVNKCDLPGAEQTARILRTMLEMARLNQKSRPGSPLTSPWEPPVILADAPGCKGIEDIRQCICQHFDCINLSGERQKRDRERLAANLDALIRDTLLLRWRSAIEPGQLDWTLDQLVSRQLSPFQAVDRLLKSTS